MAGKSKTTTSKATGNKIKSRRLRLFLALTVSTLAVAAAIALFWGTSCFLFTHNRHLRLKNVKVFSIGWWNNRTTEVRKIINIPLGTNLFKVDLKEVKTKLEEHPSIKSAQVARVLPDTLAVKITERIPRAYLFDSNSKWVVDETSMVMDRKQCVDLDRNLPVILGLDRNTKIEAGKQITRLSGALKDYFPG